MLRKDIGMVASKNLSWRVGMQASHLLVKHAQSRNPKSWKEDPVTRSPEAALTKAQLFWEQLMAGDPATLPQRFAELARTESHCSSAKRGGDLGPFKCDLSSLTNVVAWRLVIESNCWWTNIFHMF
jgi:hypothetical protein